VEVKAQLDGDSYAQMQEAMKDIAEMRVTFTGRNGFEVTFAYPVFEGETAEVEETTDYRYSDDDPFEPARIRRRIARTFIWTLRTKVTGR
jgi:endonuclease I